MSLADRTPPTEADYNDYRKRFCNWNKWGENDERGTLNYITAGIRKNAAGLITEGKVVSCRRLMDTFRGPNNPYPAHHMVPVAGTGGIRDYFGMFIHGFSMTHLDALSHLATPDKKTWNGKPMDRYGMPEEHSGTIELLCDNIVTRGVLYDVPRFRGTDFVAPGSPVHGWELMDVAKAQGIEPRSGDAVIIRMGFAPYWASMDELPGTASVTGVHASSIEFLYETEAALLVWDFQDAPTADQGLPNPAGNSPSAIHVHHIVLPYMGLPILDHAELEELAQTCAALNRWEFEFVVAPLGLPRATGSPVNPLALF